MRPVQCKVWESFVFVNLAGQPQETLAEHLPPVSVDRSVWRIRGCCPAVRNAGELLARDYSKVSLRDPMMEDCSAHELICAQMKSGAKRHVHFRDEEILARHLGNGVSLCVRDLA